MNNLQGWGLVILKEVDINIWFQVIWCLVEKVSSVKCGEMIKDVEISIVIKIMKWFHLWGSVGIVCSPHWTIRHPCTSSNISVSRLDTFNPLCSTILWFMLWVIILWNYFEVLWLSGNFEETIAKMSSVGTASP